MRKRFVALREDVPGDAWRRRFVEGRAEAEAWYRSQGRGAPPTAAQCAAQLRRHMPELLGLYERACALVGGDDEVAHQILSQYRPPPRAHGCTQAVWLGADGPALIRNYDFTLDVVSEEITSTRWLGREVIAKAQRPWGGCLDGMNADGLVASLTFGGSPALGAGFAIILVLRYVLETCSDVAGALAALGRIPVAQSHNVTVLDRSGNHATVALAPDRAAAVSRSRVCANHRAGASAVDASPALAHSLRRARAAQDVLERGDASLASLRAAFLRPPLLSRAAASPTVYTAVYRPAAATVEFVWPGHAMTQRIGAFTPGEYVHEYGALTG